MKPNQSDKAAGYTPEWKILTIQCSAPIAADVELVPNPRDYSYNPQPSVRIKGHNAQANAVLFAAAPELVEALRLALEWSDDGSPNSERSAIELEFRDKARTALKKAGVQ